MSLRIINLDQDYPKVTDTLWFCYLEVNKFQPGNPVLSCILSYVLNKLVNFNLVWE